YTQYQNRLKRAAAMDFDDLLFNMNILLRDFPDFLYKYQQKFHHILVDEYQDTNYAQYLIIKKLAANNENICVVGDDAQSIYGFRGANIQNILNFRNDYPDLQTFKLEQNYRSTKTIVNAANKVIKKNKQQISKEIWTENEEGGLIRLIRASTDTEEGTLVAQSIFELKMNQQLPNEAFAILYRTNAQSRSLEEALRRLNIPCRVYGGISFYQRKEIKDMLAYFRLAINPKDEQALLRVINYPARGIGKTTIEKLIVAADDSGSSVYEVIGNPQAHNLSLPAGTMQKIIAFLTMTRSFGAMLKTRNAYDLGKHIAASSGLLKQLYEDKTPEGVSHYENMEELLNAIKEFTESERAPVEETGEIDTSLRTLDEFMQEVALLTDADYDKEQGKDRVMLMTVHAAKGLEFPNVYLVGLEENLFPSIQSLNSRSDLEEERRLFYVALTRAQKIVTLSYAENRYRWGNLTICEPSRFISEIPEEQLDLPKKASVQPGGFHSEDNFSSLLPGMRRPRKITPADKNLKKSNPSVIPDEFNAATIESIVPGIEVLHERFGKGKVVQVDGQGPNKKATVFFQGVGQKQLLLKFARLKIT
ncbi:MAG: UvrD-helicase domain-containing protein, partial [Bacteroidia bacterium]|nr:UvrD-helicase domain-containing protein [Bacteroidia bacterium]